MDRAKKVLPLLAILFLAMLSGGERFGHVAKAQTIASVLAAQIRIQGFACDDPQKATRDAGGGGLQQQRHQRYPERQPEISFFILRRVCIL